MPIEYCTSLDLDLVYARWYGRVDFDQFRANFARYLGDAHYRAGRPELIDHSGITEFDINFGLVQSILREVNAQAPGLAVETHTVLYSPQATIYGIGRMYQSLAELAHGIRVDVFRTERAALDALELPHTSISHLLESETFLPPTARDAGI